MSVVGGAEEEGSATSSSTERPSDTIVVYLQADTASLRTKQRNEFKSMLQKTTGEKLSACKQTTGLSDGRSVEELAALPSS